MAYMNVLVIESVVDFIESLDRKTQTKTYRMIRLLREYGHHIGMPHSKPLRDGVFELRARGRKEIRLLYGYRGNGALVVCGFIKKTQSVPNSEIEKAIQVLKK
ncbi:type II toxin-antitoxin system RelE/ParE family toxin [Candidatus Kaiserbacteria bacterium]|nr:type II toxin-antitoxin system RelE/ParE family toxin [Candidatus Kaiserbacteria bacterium]